MRCARARRSQRRRRGRLDCASRARFSRLHGGGGALYADVRADNAPRDGRDDHRLLFGDLSTRGTNFYPGAAVKVSGADSVLADALVSGRATTGWTPTSSLVLCGTSVGYTNQPPEQGQLGAVRGLTGESSQAANPTSASASLGAPKLDAGSNQFVAFLGIQGAGGGTCARGDVSRLVARGRLTEANARGPYAAHSPRGLRAA